MLNHFVCMGRLTVDPELKTTTSGNSVTSFSIAVERNYGSGEKQTDFIPCVAWRNTAEFISKYFSKGQWITIEASMQSRSYENKEGKKVTVLEAVVERAHFTGDKKSNEGADLPVSNEDFTEMPVDDDLPF